MPRHPFLHGTYTIAPTPFLPTGELDRASLGTMVDMLVGLGVQGITMLGVMGEVDKLGDAERDVIIDDVITAAAGRVKICIGTSHVATDRCVALSKRAAELGADALMVAPPRLAKPNDAALRSHYQRVADAVTIPVVVQDHPISSGVLMSVDFLANLARDVPGCNYLKLEEEPRRRPRHGNFWGHGRQYAPRRTAPWRRWLHDGLWVQRNLGIYLYPMGSWRC